MSEQKFTPQQISDWEDYEEVRSEGAYNMFDPMAREATGLDREEYSFVMKNYSELKKAAEEERS
jgi:hypothetical protein